MKTWLKRLLRYLAVEHDVAVSLYRRINRPDGDEWAIYLQRRNLLHAVGERCSIQTNVTFTDPAYTRLGSNVWLTGCTLIAHDASVIMLNRALGLKLDRVGKIDIRDNVFVGHGSIILPGVTIGPNAIIAAGSVVNRDVPPGTVAAGVPARVVGQLDALIARLQTQTEQLPWAELFSRYCESADPALRANIEQARIQQFFGG